MLNGKHRLPENIIHPPAMKTAALAILYVIVAVQSLIFIGAFKVGFDSMKEAFRLSRETTLEICDQRYVQK